MESISDPILYFLTVMYALHYSSLYVRFFGFQFFHVAYCLEIKTSLVYHQHIGRSLLHVSLPLSFFSRIPLPTLFKFILSRPFHTRDDDHKDKCISVHI